MNELAARFADDVLAALATARLNDLLTTFSRAKTGSPAPTQGARTPRASDGEAVLSATKTERIEVLGRVVSYLRTHTNGVRAEELRGALGLTKRAFATGVVDGMATGEIRKEGRLRATTYFAE